MDLASRLLSWRRPRAPGSAEVSTHHRRIFILPTKAGLGYGAILFATLLGALNYQNNLGLFLTFLMGSIALVSMHHCWFQLLGLSLLARDGPPVFAGETARFPLRLAERRNKPRPQIEVAGIDPFALEAGKHVELEFARPAPARGPLALDGVLVQTTYPFGLFRAWTTLRPRAAVLVYPRPAVRAPRPRMQPHVDQRGRGDLGIGAEDFVGPRPYRPGDSPKQLDWKALARERGLVVKQFGGDQSGRAWIDWDGIQSPSALADPEQRLSLLARQVLDADALNYSYGLRLPGVRIEPNRGGLHKHHCLGALARFGIGDAGDA